MCFKKLILVLIFFCFLVIQKQGYSNSLWRILTLSIDENNCHRIIVVNGVVKTILEYTFSVVEKLEKKPNLDWCYVAKNSSILKFSNSVTKKNKIYNSLVISQINVDLLTCSLKVITNRFEILKNRKY